MSGKGGGAEAAGRAGRVRGRALAAEDEIERLREELAQARKALRAAGGLVTLGTIAASLTHEIRNPLVSIRTFFQLAPSRRDDEEFLTSFAPLAEAEIDRVCELTAGLLSLGRPEERSMCAIDLFDMLEGTLLLLSPQARKRGVRIDAPVPAQVARVRADAGQLRQVFVNVVLNAIDATPVGGVVRIRVAPAVGHGRGDWEIEVRDSGDGIPPPLREEIFRPLFTTKEGGTGLGLYIARDIVEAHGGSIEVDGAPGAGAIFRLRLPRCDVAEAAGGSDPKSSRRVA